MGATTISAIISIALSIWVYNDAKSCGVSSPILWSVGTLFLMIIVFPIYLIVRTAKQPNDTDTSAAKHDYEIVEANTKKISRLVILFVAFGAAIFLAGKGENDTAANFAPATKYANGYLRQNTTWADEFDNVYHMTALKETSRVHYNYKSTKIEIWNLDIVTADGQRNKNIVMIYFLEGKYQGRWGYTLRAYTEI